MSNSKDYSKMKTIFITSYTNSKKEIEYTIHSTKRNINYRLIEVNVKGLIYSKKYSNKNLEYVKEVLNYATEIKKLLKEIKKIGKAVSNKKMTFIITNRDELIKLLNNVDGEKIDF